MWIVAKYKNKELKTLKKNFIKVLGEPLEFYIPKIKYQKYFKQKLKTFEKFVLENYLICNHKKFEDVNTINQLKYCKGLTYFLDGSHKNQKEIIQFINHCKKHENSDGYLSQGFFEFTNFKKAKFISGPFTNMVFEIISRQKTKLKILIGGVTTSIAKKSNYLYRPI